MTTTDLVSTVVHDDGTATLSVRCTKEQVKYLYDHGGFPHPLNQEVGAATCRLFNRPDWGWDIQAVTA